MRTTARNQFLGTVKTVALAPVGAEVVVEMPGGTQIVATLTRAAAERLALRQGQAAAVLIKASAVALVTDFDGYALSARNQLPGVVSRIDRGPVSSLVTLILPSGLLVYATVTDEAVDELGLATGQEATAVFKAYAVVLGVKG